MIVFQWLWTTLILVDYETSYIKNVISLSFHAYEERLNQRSYASYALIWRNVVLDSELEINMGVR
jgi:hypothetical protein